MPNTCATVLSSDELLDLQEQAEQVGVDEALVDYMLAIVEKTRAHESLALGVSPRGAQALYRAAQALAMVEGRDYVIPDDIKRLVIPVFAHRIVVNARTSLVAAQRRVERTGAARDSHAGGGPAVGSSSALRS